MLKRFEGPSDRGKLPRPSGALVACVTTHLPTFREASILHSPQYFFHKNVRQFAVC